jgi:hypothetical protein
VSGDSEDPFQLPLHDFQFTEQQWNRIIAPLGNAVVTPANRQLLTKIVKDHAWERRFKRFSPSQAGKRLYRIAKASASLRNALANTQDDRGDEFADEGLARALLYGDFQGRDGYFRLMFTWIDLIERLKSLQKKAVQEAERYEGKAAHPWNVKEARDHTFERLAKFFVATAGKLPTASPRDSKNWDRGNIAGDFGVFVASFMSAVPGEKPPTAGAIRAFLRRREKLASDPTKKSDARHGVLRAPKRKKPLKRS